MDTTSDLLANVDFVLCLDSVGNSNPLKLHVSKPPKEGSPGEVFLRHLNSVSNEVILSPSKIGIQSRVCFINFCSSCSVAHPLRLSIRKSTLPTTGRTNINALKI